MGQEKVGEGKGKSKSNGFLVVVRVHERNRAGEMPQAWIQRASKFSKRRGRAMALRLRTARLASKLQRRTVRATCARVASLKAGPHRIEIRAMDRNGNIDPPPANLAFAVMLPWYKESGFLIISLRQRGPDSGTGRAGGVALHVAGTHDRATG